MELKWMELDRRSDARDLCGLNRFATYSASMNEFFRRIRLQQAGRNSSGTQYLTVSAFELFGVLRTL
jgi:hypothetical protein